MLLAPCMAKTCDLCLTLVRLSVSSVIEHGVHLIVENQMTLASWDGHKLVGIEGSAIPILGVTQNLSINFTGMEVDGDFVVASALNSEAILGLDFLERNQCCINMEQKVLHLKGKALHLTRDPAPIGTLGSKEAKVILQEQVVLPPHSVMEVVARVEASTVDCNCILLAEDLSQKSNFVVANALVTPHQSDEIASIPVWLLNTSVDSVVIQKGTTVAHASTLEQFDLVANTVGTRVVTSDDSQGEVTPQQHELLWGLVENLEDTLDQQQKHHLFNLLLGYADVFALSNDHMGRTKQLKHKINTGDHQPIRQQARRIPPCKREEVHQLLQDMLACKVIQPSTSLWASPVVLVKKKDGSTRFCIDYHKINAITHKDAYPLPRIDDTLDTLSGAQWLSTVSPTEWLLAGRGSRRR